MRTVIAKVTDEDARRQAGLPLRTAAVVDDNDLDVLPSEIAALGDSLRPTDGNEAIGVSCRFAVALDSVTVVVVGYAQAKSDGSLKRVSIQEGVATATARFDAADGFWAKTLFFPTAGAALYQIRFEVPAGVLKVFTWTF